MFISFLSYISFGFSVGFTVGISSSEIVGALLAFLFYFIGVKFQKAVVDESNSKSAIFLLGFSLSITTGLIAGIYIKENRILTNLDRIIELCENDVRYCIEPRDYLRDYTLD